MEIQGFKNMRHEGFEDTLRSAGYQMDAFFSNAVWKKYIQSPDRAKMDTRLYDVLCMALFQRAVQTADKGARQFVVHFVRQGETTLLAHSHPEVMALCFSLPDEKREKGIEKHRAMKKSGLKGSMGAGK